MTDTAPLKRILEAALLASTQPLALPQLAALFGEHDAPTHEELARAIEELTADCAERGVELVEVASGFRYQVRQDVHPWIARLWTERQSRYSRALLETLALIAYRQPITRAEIEQIRGVAVSTHIIKTLEEREWVRVVGHRDMPGRPALFGTTRGFLDYFNLKSLDQLPALSDLRDIDEIEPQLALAHDDVAPEPIAADAQALAEAAAAALDATDTGDATPVSDVDEADTADTETVSETAAPDAADPSFSSHGVEHDADSTEPQA